MDGASYGRWLRAQRGRRGEPGFLSQQALADRVGVLRTYINQIESGRIAVPDKPLRDRIHAALGTSDAELEALGVLSPPVAATTLPASPRAGIRRDGSVSPAPDAAALAALTHRLGTIAAALRAQQAVSTRLAEALGVDVGQIAEEVPAYADDRVDPVLRELIASWDVLSEVERAHIADLVSDARARASEGIAVPAARRRTG